VSEPAAALVKYDAARLALQVAHSIDEVAGIRDEFAARAAAAKIARDHDLVYWAKEIVLRAERKAGTMLADGVPHQGGRPKKGNGGMLPRLKITRDESKRWQRAAAVPEKEFEKYLTDTKAARRELTSSGVRKLAKQSAPRQRHHEIGREYCTTEDLASLAGREFGTIYADPPWSYGNQGTRASTGDHYLGLTVDQICALPVHLLAAQESHLHLWTTNAFLFDAKRVLEAWGFTYKSCFIWVKPQIGMGNYWRVSHEFLLLGVRGTLTFPDKTLRSWGEFKRSQHSAKPERVRDLIHRASPGPYLELFARRAVPGWTCWGNEIKRDILSAEVAA
jgi:N6-adenosine-specific RNA methylase IME4